MSDEDENQKKRLLAGLSKQKFETKVGEIVHKVEEKASTTMTLTTDGFKAVAQKVHFVVHTLSGTVQSAYVYYLTYLMFCIA